MTHICVSKLTIIGSDNGLSPGRRQAIIWTNAELLLVGPLRTKFSEILIEIHTFSFKKMHLKMSAGKWRPFCLGLNVLNSTKVIKRTSSYIFTHTTRNVWNIQTRSGWRLFYEQDSRVIQKKYTVYTMQYIYGFVLLVLFMWQLWQFTWFIYPYHSMLLWWHVVIGWLHQCQPRNPEGYWSNWPLLNRSNI